MKKNEKVKNDKRKNMKNQKRNETMRKNWENGEKGKIKTKWRNGKMEN